MYTASLVLVELVRPDVERLVHDLALGLELDDHVYAAVVRACLDPHLVAGGAMLPVDLDSGRVGVTSQAGTYTEQICQVGGENLMGSPTRRLLDELDTGLGLVEDRIAVLVEDRRHVEDRTPR